MIKRHCPPLFSRLNPHLVGIRLDVPSPHSIHRGTGLGEPIIGRIRALHQRLARTLPRVQKQFENINKTILKIPRNKGLITSSNGFCKSYIKWARTQDVSVKSRV